MMGFSSFLTSDTEESILNIYTGLSKTVYMLQPNGLDPIEEEAYQGYMTFDSIDVFEWIVKINALDTLCSAQDIRILGVALLLCGGVYIDVKTQEKFSLYYCELLDDIQTFSGSYSELQDGYKYSPNELISNGVWKEIDIADLLDIKNIYLPRFSFNKNTIYENVPDAQSCPIQGFFIEDIDKIND